MENSRHADMPTQLNLNTAQLQKLDAAKTRLQEDWRELQTGTRLTADEAAGLALLPLRLTFGLALAIGTLWGLWNALAWLLR